MKLYDEDDDDDSAYEASSNSEGSSDESDSGWVPRNITVALNQQNDRQMKAKANNPKLFTKGTSPLEKDILKFMTGENVVCPQFLPMLYEDVQLTSVAIAASANDSSIPLSEHIRKEFFYHCFNKFTKALASEPALFAE